MSDVGRVRSNNEDAFLLYSLEKDEKLRPRGSETTTAGKGALFIVSDGMGGANAGEVASNIAIQTMIAEIKKNSGPDPSQSPQNTSALLEQAFQVVHQNILKSAEQNPEQEGMGATMTLLWLASNCAWLGQVGDSRLYRLNAKGIHQISQDQSPVGELMRCGKITPEQARHHPQRNLLDQALGAGLEILVPHIETLHFEENDSFLLCSDGLSDAMRQEAILDFVAEKARWSIPTACKYLINEANEAYGQDNITVALCRIMHKITS